MAHHMAVREAREMLREAVCAGELGRIAQALAVPDMYVDELCRNDDGEEWTALGWATTCGNLDAFRMLLAAGANAGWVGEDKSVVGIAVGTPNAALIREAVAAREAVAPHLPPLHVAACADDDGSAVAAVLAGAASAEERAALVNAVASAEDRGGSALHMAAACGNAGAVAALAAAGGDLEAADSEERIPLMMAIVAGHAGGVRALLAAGASANGERRRGARPLCVASENGHVEVVRALLDAGARADTDMQYVSAGGWRPITSACWWGFTDVVHTLLAAGAAANRLIQEEHSPLHVAACRGHVSLVESLLRAGAEVDVRDGPTHFPDTSSTPLWLAAHHGRVSTMAVLLAAGADPTAESQAGVSVSDAIPRYWEPAAERNEIKRLLAVAITWRRRRAAVVAVWM
jgi:ankyrin repeat protein